MWVVRVWLHVCTHILVKVLIAIVLSFSIHVYTCNSETPLGLLSINTEYGTTGLPSWASIMCILQDITFTLWCTRHLASLMCRYGPNVTG